MLRLFEGVDFIAYRNVAVQRVLCVRIRSQGPNKKRTVRKIGGHGVLVVVIYDFYRTAVLFILSHPFHVVAQEVIGFQRLHKGS